MVLQSFGQHRIDIIDYNWPGKNSQEFLIVPHYLFDLKRKADDIDTVDLSVFIE